ncbi:helix-turn-helix domain-containing protein [Deinococcus ruber]|uniref:helix-turn-helix domain-containing protein n=1 Tax=Deinococcus ruber TaxID=1848197 RepID=UPI00357124C5
MRQAIQALQALADQGRGDFRQRIQKASWTTPFHVHVNTLRYRLRRIEDVLEGRPASTSRSCASFGRDGPSSGFR